MKMDKMKKGLLLVVFAMVFTWGFNVWDVGQGAQILNPWTQQYENVENWQLDSESWIWGRALAAQHGEIFSLGGLLRRYGEPTEERERFIADDMPQSIPEMYLSNSGLQGTTVALAAMLLKALHLNNGQIVDLAAFCTTAAFVCVVLLLCEWLYTEVSWLAALAAFLGMFSYPWVAVSVRNIYWVTWTMLLPTVIVARWARAVARGQKANRGGVLVPGAGAPLYVRI